VQRLLVETSPFWLSFIVTFMASQVRHCSKLQTRFGCEEEKDAMISHFPGQAKRDMPCYSRRIRKTRTRKRKNPEKIAAIWKSRVLKFENKEMCGYFANWRRGTLNIHTFPKACRCLHTPNQYQIVSLST
jgi:hypothetical protein